MLHATPVGGGVAPISVDLSTACTQELARARQVHAELVRLGSKPDGYAGTILVNSYVKCGQLLDARHVFDTMDKRNVVLWNAMIMGYARLGEGEEALHLYAKMQEEGLVPNDRTFVGALKACSSMTVREEWSEAGGILVKKRCLMQVRAIHSHLLQSRHSSVIFVETMLVDVYSKCGSLVDARNAFERMSQRNVVSWTAMIFGFAQQGEGELALQFYVEMQQEGVAPNKQTFLGVLKACSTLAAVQQRANEIDDILLRRRCLDHARAIHLHALQTGLEIDRSIGNMLIDVYVKCGNMADARSIFEKMPHRDLLCWNAMITGYTRFGEAEKALVSYIRMQEAGVIPDGRTFFSALKACSVSAAVEGNEATVKQVKKQCLDRAREIHGQMQKGGCEMSLSLQTLLVDVYAKCGSMVDARLVFEEMPCHDVVSWTSMILGYAQMAEGEMALQFYREMKQEGVVPDDRAFVGALKACSSLATAGQGHRVVGEYVLERYAKVVRAIHSDAVGGGMEFNVFVATMLVDAYARCGSLEDARHVFETIPHRSVASWNAMIMGYSQCDKGDEALRLYTRMGNEGVVPTDRTFVAALKACGSVTGLKMGMQIHAEIQRNGLATSGLYVQTALVDMYGKCGSMEHAQQVFDTMAVKDVAAWNALIAGYCHQGESMVVFDLLQLMRRDCVHPDRVTFLSVLSVCSHCGLVEMGSKLFVSMSCDYGITPSMDHYTCLVDLLGRAGHLDRAMAVVKLMPSEPDGAVWLTVMCACLKWSNVEVGRQAFDAAVRLNETATAAYVLMANIYAAAHRWTDSKNIQSLRVRLGAWKLPGQSYWTNTYGDVCEFSAEDAEHPDSLVVHAKLRELYVKLAEDRFC